MLERWPLFAGAWSAGEHSYPFEIPAPGFPASYRGGQLSWGWLVVAHATVNDERVVVVSGGLSITGGAEGAG